MVQVHELEIFAAAAEQENFSAAARKLHLSQPAVSFKMQALEQRLKVQLFQRIGRRIVLTEAGRDLLPMAREMVNLSSRIEESMCAAQGMVKGHVVIGCSTSPGKYVLPHLIGEFRNLCPDVRFTVEVMDRQAVEGKLIQQQIDIGVLSLSSHNRDLECWPLFTDAMVLIAGTTHPWAKRDRIAPEELSQAEWILREGGAATRHLVLAGLAERGMSSDDLHVAMELGSVEAVEAAVEAGHGVSFVSRIAVQRGLDLGRIRVIPVDGMVIQRVIFLARNRLRACTCAQSKFREFVESPVGKQVIARVTG